LLISSHSGWLVIPSNTAADQDSGMQGMATPAGNQVLFSTKFSGVLAAE